MNTPERGVLFILVGPSGVGKNAIMKSVLPRFGLRQMPTVTTRSPRDGEHEGQQHFFVSIEQFRKMLDEGRFAEYQENYPGIFYGTPRAQLEELLNSGARLIADIDVVGASKLKELHPDRVIQIFIAPPSRDVLEARLRERGQMSEAELAERLKRADFEMTFESQADYRIVNDDLDETIEQAAEIISNELMEEA